jgi:hypothetical protein
VTPLVLMVLAVDHFHLDSRREAGAEDCPDEQQLQRSVAERLGSNPFTSDATKTVAVRWKSQGGVLSSELTVTNETGSAAGSKKLTSTAKSCDELAASTALALALIIDPLSITRPAPEPQTELQPPPNPPTTPLEEPPPPPSVAPIVTVEARPQAARPSQSSLWLGGEVGASMFEVPSELSDLSATVSFDLAVSWEWVMLGGRATFVIPGTRHFDEGSISATVLGLGPFLCVGSSRVGGCAAVRVGAVYAWASGYADAASSGAMATLAFSLGPYLDFAPANSLKLRVFLNGQLQPATAVLMVRNAVAWRTPLFAVIAGVSLFGRP